MRGLLWLGVLIISLAGLFRAEKVGILMVGKTPRELYDQVLTTLQTKIRLRETKCPSVLDEFIKEDFKQGGATFCFQFISFKSDKYERFAEFRAALEQSVPRNFKVIFGWQEDYGSIARHYAVSDLPGWSFAVDFTPRAIAQGESDYHDTKLEGDLVRLSMIYNPPQHQ